MTISKRDIIKFYRIFGLTICVFLGLSQPGLYAKEKTPSFNTYSQAQADVVWTRVYEAEEVISQGTFFVSLPDKFVYTIDDANSRVHKITGYQSLLGLHLFNGQVDYDYSSLSLFNVYEKLFGSLLKVANQSGTWLSDGTLVGRQVQLFQVSESRNNYWYDRETGIPIKITDQKGNSLLSLKQYKVQPYTDGEMMLLNLETRGSDWDGLIVLENLEGYWLPQKLSFTEGNQTVTIDYSNWQLLEEAFQIPDLERLNKYLDQGYAAYQGNDLENILANFKQVLRIDPFNIQAYAYLSYAYGELGNYLGAVESYQQWLMLDPHNATALNNLAYTYMLADNFVEQAISMAYQSYQLNPSPYTLDTLGYGYYLIKDYEKALYYLDCAKQELTDTNDIALINVLEHLVLVYQALEDWANVEKCQQQIEVLKMETEDGRTLF